MNFGLIRLPDDFISLALSFPVGDYSCGMGKGWIQRESDAIWWMSHQHHHFGIGPPALCVDIKPDGKSGRVYFSVINMHCEYDEAKALQRVKSLYSKLKLADDIRKRKEYRLEMHPLYPPSESRTAPTILLTMALSFFVVIALIAMAL